MAKLKKKNYLYKNLNNIINYYNTYSEMSKQKLIHEFNIYILKTKFLNISKKWLEFKNINLKNSILNLISIYYYDKLKLNNFYHNLIYYHTFNIKQFQILVLIKQKFLKQINLIRKNLIYIKYTLNFFFKNFLKKVVNLLYKLKNIKHIIICLPKIKYHIN